MIFESDEIKPVRPEPTIEAVIALTDDELAEARKLLLPSRMKRHDTAFEAKLRHACDEAQRRRRGKPLSD